MSETTTAPISAPASATTPEQLAADAVWLSQVIEDRSHDSGEIAVHGDDFIDVHAALQAVVAAKNRGNSTQRRIVRVPARYGIRGAHAELDTVVPEFDAPRDGKALVLLIEIHCDHPVSKAAQIPVISDIRHEVLDCLRGYGDDRLFVLEMVFVLHPAKK